jgi:hypothetical protein
MAVTEIWRLFRSVSNRAGDPPAQRDSLADLVVDRLCRYLDEADDRS